MDEYSDRYFSSYKYDAVTYLYCNKESSTRHVAQHNPPIEKSHINPFWIHPLFHEMFPNVLEKISNIELDTVSK